MRKGRGSATATATVTALADAGIVMGTKPILEPSGAIKEPKYRGDPAALSLRGAKAKTNFPINPSNIGAFPIEMHDFHKDAFIDDRRRMYPMGNIRDPEVNPQRPTRNSTSITVESFSGPRPAQLPPQSAEFAAVSTRKYHPRTPVEPEDCRSDCDSSSSVVVDDGDIASSLCKKNALPFDFNFPPLDEVDDIYCTALCL